MTIKQMSGVLAFVLLTAAAVPASAQNGVSADDCVIYGSWLMNEEERREYRMELRNAKTAAERKRVNDEHHAFIKARMEERGVDESDRPEHESRDTERARSCNGDAGNGAGGGEGGGTNGAN